MVPEWLLNNTAYPFTEMTDSFDSVICGISSLHVPIMFSFRLLKFILRVVPDRIVGCSTRNLMGVTDSRTNTLNIISPSYQVLCTHRYWNISSSLSENTSRETPSDNVLKSRYTVSTTSPRFSNKTLRENPFIWERLIFRQLKLVTTTMQFSLSAHKL